MTYKGKWPGTWATICDVCGFRFPSSKLKKRWDGLMTCETDWETRHPQTLIKIRSEHAVPDFVRHPNEVFLYVCDPPSSSGYVGLGRVGCARVGNNSLPYDDLLHWYDNGHENPPNTCTATTRLGIVGSGTVGCATIGNT